MLQKHDFAFVKRSDGSYSYAILAFRSFEPIKKGTGTEECMTFVTNKIGSTKIIRERHWSEFIRMPSPVEQRTVHTPASCLGVTNESEDMVPGMVSFDMMKSSEEECSLIS